MSRHASPKTSCAVTEHHFLPPKAIGRYESFEAREAPDGTAASSDGAVYLRMVCAQIFWAGAFVASEIALAEQPPALTAVVRFVLTTAAYALLCATTGRGARPPLTVRLRQLTQHVTARQTGKPASSALPSGREWGVA